MSFIPDIQYDKEIGAVQEQKYPALQRFLDSIILRTSSGVSLPFPRQSTYPDNRSYHSAKTVGFYRKNQLFIGLSPLSFIYNTIIGF